MRQPCLPWYLLFSLCIAQKIVLGQVSDDQMQSWAAKLSLKMDSRSHDFNEVLHGIQKQDTTIRCQIVEDLGRVGTARNKRFQIRLLLLQALVVDLQSGCQNLPEGITLFNEAMKMAYELEDPYLITVTHKHLANCYRNLNAFALAMTHLQIAIEGQEKLGLQQFHHVAFDRYALGELLYLTRQYRSSIASFKLALELDADNNITREDSINDITKMFLYNNLGLAYRKVTDTDAAHTAFTHAHDLANKIKLTEWTSLTMGNIGDVFYDQGQYDTAEILLRQDVIQSLSGGKNWVDNAAKSLVKLADIHLHDHQIQLALTELRRAESLLQGGTYPSVLADIYAIYMKVFTQTGEEDSLFLYFNKFLQQHSTVENKAANEQAEIIQVQLNNQENIHHVQTLQKEKKRIALIRNFVIIAILLFAVCCLLYFHRLRLKMLVIHKQALAEKERAQTEAMEALNQLRVFTQNMVEKTKLVETLQEQLLQKEKDEQQILQIQELSYHPILTDDDWTHFKILFEQVHPGFFKQLQVKSPDISQAEQRVAALAKLQIMPKHAAGLLGITHAAVNRTRQRLRQRLGLDPDTDLDIYFSIFPS